MCGLAHSETRICSFRSAEVIAGETMGGGSDWVDVASTCSSLYHEGIKCSRHQNLIGPEHLLYNFMDGCGMVGGAIFVRLILLTSGGASSFQYFFAT
mmetsp:Transcript_15632/g.45104  ORF Transcript_15632/g.45104 Transcript_15632/m.45104 type:complete len:97 (-) Transcript_15632:121-411(-)